MNGKHAVKKTEEAASGEGHGRIKKEALGAGKMNKVNDAVMRLLEGNARFQSDPERARERKETKDGQRPKVQVVYCSDSRSPAEILVDDTRIGQIFGIRSAGNLLTPELRGAVQYGYEHLGSKVVVVLGHSKCGAITAACGEGQAEGDMGKLIKRLAPAVERARNANPDAGKAELVELAVIENVKEMIAYIRKNKVLRDAEKKGDLEIIGAKYDVETGKIELLG